MIHKAVSAVLRVLTLLISANVTECVWESTEGGSSLFCVSHVHFATLHGTIQKCICQSSQTSIWEIFSRQFQPGDEEIGTRRGAFVFCSF